MQSSHQDPDFTVRLADPGAGRTDAGSASAGTVPERTVKGKSFRQRRRNRHGRGLRGELMLPTLPGYRTRSDIFDDLCGEFMGGRRGQRQRSSRERGADLRYNLEISLTEAFAGKTAQICVPTSVSCSSSPRASGIFTSPSLVYWGQGYIAAGRRQAASIGGAGTNTRLRISP